MALRAHGVTFAFSRVREGWQSGFTFTADSSAFRIRTIFLGFKTVHRASKGSELPWEPHSKWAARQDVCASGVEAEAPGPPGLLPSPAAAGAPPFTADFLRLPWLCVPGCWRHTPAPLGTGTGSTSQGLLGRRAARPAPREQGPWDAAKLHRLSCGIPRGLGPQCRELCLSSPV